MRKRLLPICTRLRRRERALECKGRGRVAMGPEQFQALFCLGYRGNMPGRHPPKYDVRAFHWLEPLAAAAHNGAMRAFVHVRPELLDRLPDRHVDQNVVVVEWADRGCVSIAGLQAPDEARAMVG